MKTNIIIGLCMASLAVLLLVGVSAAEYSKVAPYESPASGTANWGPAGTREHITYNHEYRIRQDGDITNVTLWVGPTANITGFNITVWRANGTNFDRIALSEDVSAQFVSNSINYITFSSPLLGIAEGDFYGYRIYTSIASPHTFHADNEAVTSTYYTDSAVTTTTGYNWKSQTSSTYAMRVDQLMEHPSNILIGDSIIAGHPAHYSFIEPDDTTVLGSAINVHLHNLTSQANQNMGIGGQTTTQISARFTSDVINASPGMAIIEGGVNDIAGGSITQTTFLDNYEAMLVKCKNNDIRPVVILIMPWTNGNTAQMNTRDQWNANLTTLAGTYDATVIDTSTYIGKYRPTGPANNLWDINSSYDVDGVHFNSAGHTQIAQAIYDNMSVLWHYHRSPTSGGAYSSSPGVNVVFSAVTNNESNNTWYFDSSVVEYDNGTKYPIWTNDSTIIGNHNLTLHSSDGMGTAQTVWDWDVYASRLIGQNNSDWDDYIDNYESAVERGNHTITLDHNVSDYRYWWDHWTNNTGSTLLWDVARDNDGTIGTGGAWEGDYIHYDGVGYTTLASKIDYAAPDSWSLSFWAELDSGETTQSMIMGDTADTSDFIWLYAGNYFRFRNSDDPSADADFTGLTTFTGMHHYLLIANGTHIVLYKNNTYQDTKTITTTFEMDAIARGYNNNAYNFDGIIGGISVYNKTLDSTERGCVYNGCYKSTGNATSIIIDSGADNSVLDTIQVNGTFHDSTRVVDIHLNTSDDNSSWSGWTLLQSNVSSGTEYPVGSSNGKRYYKFRCVLVSTQSTHTPIIETIDVTQALTASPSYTPPTPLSLTNTTGNFWVNHTWAPGSGNVTDSYNISVNAAWYNGTTVAYNNTTLSAHAWANITICAFNSSGTGTLSAGSISQNTQIPNNPITITNTSDWSDDAGENVYVDYDATDADNDSPTFCCNRTDLFADFSTITGRGNWTSVVGTYYVDFGVSDGYGSTSNYTMTITVGGPVFTITLQSSHPETIHTNYTGYIQVNYIVSSTNPLNLSSLAALYGINYTPTGDMHSYVAVPPNSIAAEGIYRAPNRNATPYLSWENNITITEDNVWQWGGGDNSSWWITKTPTNATHTWMNATGIPEHVFQSSFYLKKTSMYSAVKTPFEVNSQQGIIMKMWDNEELRGRSGDYLVNMFFDSDWESTAPTDPIEIWMFNSSFNPDTDDPATSEFGAKVVEWDGNRWVNHSWVPGSNASYALPLTFNATSFPVNLDETNYIYLKSATQTSKSYVLNTTADDPEICNITFAQTETMWTYSELSGESTQVAYTPSYFTTFARDDEEFLHHMYIANDQGDWAHSDINSISIGVSHYPVSPTSFDYFNITCPTLGYALDTGMGSTYDNGYAHIGVYVHADPDGGAVSHNITLHYINETLAGIINNTFQTTLPGLHEINFTTTPYYSTTDAYILKCVSTDDEGAAVTTWLDSFFTLAADGTQGYYKNDYLMFWGMNDIPTLYATVANNSLISYDAGDDIYTMHVPFFKSKYNDTFRFNETVHLESLNTEDVAYFRFGGETIFNNANIHGWNTTTDTPAPSTDAYRGYVFSRCLTSGNITNSNLSYLGSDIYQQEGLNFIGNTMDYLIYNTTLSHNSRGVVIEECESFSISHCIVSDNAETGIGVYYSDNNIIENTSVCTSAYDPCIYLYEASDNSIQHNTVADCADYGIRIRSNSNNNTFTSNNITGSGVYDYYFSSAAINNTIRDPASATDKIRVTSTSHVNIENTDNTAFIEDSSNSTYAYPTNFSMSVTGVTHAFNITPTDITIIPISDSVEIWNIVWGNVVTFNASNVSGTPSVWFNITNSAWANANITISRDDVIYANETADAVGAIAYNYSGGWSGHWFGFASPNAAPDKPTVVTPANGATGTSTNPTLTVQVTDDNSADILDVTFYAQGGAQIGSTQTGITNGSTASVVWSGRSYSTTYYWYAIVDDGTAQTQSDTWNFTTQSSGSGSSHVITITGCTDWEGNAGNQVYIDFGCTGETAGATFTTDATNGSIDSSSGVYTWNTATADAGVYNWRFTVENVYSVSDYCDVTVTVYHYASPLSLDATTGNFWADHTWGGNGYVDSYNVSVNGVWTNGSATQSYYHIRSPHAWSNISVAAFNDTTGLSSFVSNDVQVPNNAIVLTNYTTLMLATAGDNVTVDMNHEDLDGDAATYYCSRMDLFTDFNTADGTGQYTNAINGTHEVIFGVTDGYGWSNQTITIEVGSVHPLELNEETPLLLFVVLVVLLFGSLFYIYHAASYVAKIVTALISTWMSFMLSNMAVSGNVVLNYAELSSGDTFIYGTHSIQIAALSHFFMFTGVVSAIFMLAFAVKLVIDTYLDIQEKRKADEEWDGVE